jgi:uncharacterized hydrophobic protein (TIGR00271 family)
MYICKTIMNIDMSVLNKIWDKISEIGNISEHVDLGSAEKSIRNNVYFKGPNVWILAFSIVIASVGLNVNSTAVIIGAMLISPLMGPIIGIGLGIGINDSALLKDGARNLLIMMGISLLASFIYFLISPLNPVNPTELISRTNPSIYDVLIAFFGGFAGILEQCRKEKGTVLAGVAIATALMPPLCTAGYGLAHLNMGYFLGALFLFFINGIFIILATYLAVRYLKFPFTEYSNPTKAKRTKRIITIVTLLVVIPSIWSAFVMIRKNNFERNVIEFVAQNRTFSKGYILDYKILNTRQEKAEIFISGESLSSNEKNELIASASNFGIKKNQIDIVEQLPSDNNDESSKLMQGIFARTDTEISRREEQVRSLEAEIKILKDNNIPYSQIAREISTQYPEITDVSMAKGAEVHTADSVKMQRRIMVIAKSAKPIGQEKIKHLTDWLKLRLNDTTVVVINQR